MLARIRTDTSAPVLPCLVPSHLSVKHIHSCCCWWVWDRECIHVYVCAQSATYFHSCTLACMNVHCTVLWNVCKIFEVWCRECLHIPAWVIVHCSNTSGRKDTQAYNTAGKCKNRLHAHTHTHDTQNLGCCTDTTISRLPPDILSFFHIHHNFSFYVCMLQEVSSTWIDRRPTLLTYNCR